MVTSAISALDPRVLLLDGKGGILRWSRLFWHRSRQPLEGPRRHYEWEQFFQDTDVRAIEDVLADGRAKRDVATEHSWSTPGEDFDTTWSSLTVRNPSGHVEFVVLTGVRDDPNAVPLSGSSRSRLLGDSPFAMWAFDRGTYRFLAVNDTTASRYGYSRVELRSMRILDVWPWEEVPRLVETVTELASGQGTRNRWRHRRKDGTVFDVEDDVIATESAGRPVCLVLSRAADEDSSASRGPSHEAPRRTGPGLTRFRSQAAIIRALTDHMKHVARPESADGRGEQLIEEMDRLRSVGSC